MDAHKTRILWLICALIGLSAAVRFYGIDTQSLWFDEGWSAFAAARPTLLDAWNADTTNPPLYYVLLNIAAHLWGDSAFGLRVFSFFCGLLGVALSARLGRSLFGPRAAVFAAGVAAFSPLLWWAAQEARMYTLLALLVLAAAWGWHAVLRGPNRWGWGVLWAAELGLLYAHNTGPIAAVWLNVVTLLAWLVLRSARRPDWRLWIAGQVGVALLWLPYFVNRYLLLSSANSAVGSAPEIGLPLLKRIWSAFWVGNWTLINSPGYPRVEDTLYGFAFFVFLLVLVLWPRTRAGLWLAVHALLLTVGLVAGLMVLGNELHGRYLVMVAPLLAVGLGAGMARTRPRTLGWVALLSLVPILFLVIGYTRDPVFQHDDARAMVQFYADELTAEDTVLAWSYADRYELAYYWDRLGVTAKRVTLPEGADLDEITPLIPSSGRVALNVWYTQRADYRGMMRCLLSHGAPRTATEFITYGMSNLLFSDRGVPLPQMRPLAISSSVAQVEAVGEIFSRPADDSLCLPVELILNQQTPAELKAALVAYSPDGREIARADAVFAQADQQTSVSAAVGSRLTAYPLLELPFGAPPGGYRLALRLYDETELSGYELAQPSGVRSREVSLGIWNALDRSDWDRVPADRRGVPSESLLSFENFELITADYGPDHLVTGQPSTLALLWHGSGPLPVLRLFIGPWSMRIPPEAPGLDQWRLDWRTFSLPSHAPSGTADLVLPDGRILYTITVDRRDAVFTEPPVEVRIEQGLEGVGQLVGYTLPDGQQRMTDDLFSVDLVWLAEGGPAPMDYTVFVQLIGADGQVLAQSDHMPRQGSNPTTAWVDGEYIVDDHWVRFKEVPTAPVEGRLIVGMYDWQTGERVRVVGMDTDAIELGTITIE